MKKINDHVKHLKRKPFLKSNRKIRKALKAKGILFPGTKAAGMGEQRWLQVKSFQHDLGGPIQ